MAAWILISRLALCETDHANVTGKTRALSVDADLFAEVLRE